MTTSGKYDVDIDQINTSTLVKQMNAEKSDLVCLRE